MLGEKETEKCVSKRLWTTTEDELLKELVDDPSNVKWAVVAANFNERLPSVSEGARQRTNKQCRQRWLNHLSPSINNSLPWTQQEQQKMLEIFVDHPHKWCQIADALVEAGFEKRGENNIKNHFNSLLKRTLKSLNNRVLQNNREVKKKKSYMLKYKEKYAYRKRLSLQRQIKITGVKAEEPDSSLCNNGKSNIEEEKPFKDMVENQAVEAEQVKEEDVSEISATLSDNLRIMKPISLETITKLLEVAEDKGDKKYTIKNQTISQQAVKLRSELFEFMVDPTFPSERVISMASSILQMSRKCKRKTKKMGLQDLKPEKGEEPALSVASHGQNKLSVEDKSKSKSSSSKELGIFSQINQSHVKQEPQPTERERQLFQFPNFKNVGACQKFFEEASDIECPLFESFNFQRNKFSLDRSSEFSNIFTPKLPEQQPLTPLNNDKQPQFSFPLIGLEESRDYKSVFPGVKEPMIDLFKSQQAARPLKEASKGLDSTSNLAELNFISSIKEVNPARQPLLNSQAFSVQFSMPKPPSRHQNHPQKIFSFQRSASRAEGSQKSHGAWRKCSEDAFVDPQEQNQFSMNRSWAYSEPAFPPHVLFNSFNYGTPAPELKMYSFNNPNSHHSQYGSQHNDF